MKKKLMYHGSIICSVIFMSVLLLASVNSGETSRRAASQARTTSSSTNSKTSSVNRPTNSNKTTVNNRSAKTNRVTTTNRNTSTNRTTVNRSSSANNPQWVEQNQYGSVRQSNNHQNAQNRREDENRPAQENITASCNGTTQIWGRGNFQMRLTGNLSVDSRTRVQFQSEGRNFAKARRGDFWEYRNVDTNVTINGSNIELTARGNMRSFEGEGSGTLTMTGSGSFRTGSQSGRVPASGVTIDFGRNRGVY